LLSSGNQLLHEKEFEGEVSAVSFRPQKSYRLALKHNSSAMILAHNHSSGNPEPTQRDIETTKELIEIGNKIGIELLDHIIVGKSTQSMRKNSSVKF
jgi:DNA repair protein RadC